VIGWTSCRHTTKNQTTAGKRLFTTKELVDQLGVTEWYWRSQVWPGRLPYVQAGRKILIDHQDIEAVIERHKKRYLAQ